MESCLTYLWHWYISVIWIHHTDRRGLRSFAWFLFVSMFLLVFSKFKSVCFSLVSICRFLTLWHISFNAFASPDLIYKKHNSFKLWISLCISVLCIIFQILPTNYAIIGWSNFILCISMEWSGKVTVFWE